MGTVFKELNIRKFEEGDIGLEIEVEGRNLPMADKYWRNEVDGSLKAEESREYVLSKPSDLPGVRKALLYLDELYKNHSTVVDNSVRAGVHVHINCQTLTMTQLYNFITVYLILENLLVKWCGEFREGNLFCLRVSDAEFILPVLKSAANDNSKNFKRRFHKDELRYASMNLKALGDYGSLEFRAMRGTRDLDLVYIWAETLYNLREFAKTFEKPTDIIELFSLDGVAEFVRKALGDNFNTFATENLEAIVWEGLRNAQDVAYCCDWIRFEPKTKMIGGLEFPEFNPNEDINEPLEDF